jgi:hypothetical protein
MKGIVFLTVFFLTVFFSVDVFGQQRPESSVMGSPSTSLWLGTYGKFRLSERFFWDAQFHYRTSEYEGTPFVGRKAQIYNRHALNYLVSPNFSMSLGPVLRLNFTPDPGNPEFESLRLEPRIWHEYLFSMPFPKYIIYHRIRIEHRWSIGNRITDEWIYRDRWRYKFFMAIPINKPAMQPGAFYLMPDFEIIMQSGKPVIDSPLEDLRINPTIGYIANPRTKYTMSMMWTTGQRLSAGYDFPTRWILRLNVYLSLDFRKFEDKIPEAKLRD